MSKAVSVWTCVNPIFEPMSMLNPISKPMSMFEFILNPGTCDKSYVCLTQSLNLCIKIPTLSLRMWDLQGVFEEEHDYHWTKPSPRIQHKF